MSHASALSPAPRRVWAALVVLCLAALLLALGACSGEQDGGNAEPYPPPDPPFYELANSNGEVEGWLFGTIHALPDDVLWRTPAIDRAAKKADLLVVEVAHIGASNDAAAVFAELSYTQGLPPITARVSAELRPSLDAMLARSNVSQTDWRRAEDWAAAIMLARIDAPGDPRNGVDRSLIAQFEGREVRGLETARGQLGVFDGLSPQAQRDMLERTVAQWADTKAQPERLMRAWLSGDLAVLENATNEGILAYPELRDALLVGRNRDWMAQLLPVLESDPKPFIGVGAAHLVGPDGLVAALEEAGYTVTRLPA